MAANSIWSGATHDGSENYLINELGYKSQNRSTNSILNFEMVTTATDQTPYEDDVSCFNFLYADQLFSHYENPTAIGQNFVSHCRLRCKLTHWSRRFFKTTHGRKRQAIMFSTLILLGSLFRLWVSFITFVIHQCPLIEVDDEMQTGQVVQTDFE